MTDNKDDEIVMYILARKDLNMSPGKLASQVGHAVQLALEFVQANDGLATYLEKEYYEEWKNDKYVKIVLEVNSLDEMRDINLQLINNLNMTGAYVEDEGRTELTGRNITCMGIPPYKKSRLRPYLGHLRLYK